MTLNDLRALLSVANVRAFLRVIRARESSQDDSAYTVLNGGSHFSGWTDHPFKGQRTPPALAAGAYQFIASTWAEVSRLYGLTDFSPANQDMGAVGRIIYRKALDDVLAGRFESAVAKCRLEWTSLPGAAESTSSWTMDKARAVFLQYGGGVASTEPAAPADIAPPEVSAPQPEIPMGAGLLAAILPQVLQLFSGKAQERIAQTTGSSPDVAAQFMQALIGKIGLAVGVPVTNDATATQAVGTFAARSDPAAIKALEADALMSLDQLLKVTDKAAEYDKIKWQAEMDGRDAAARRALGERWDMTPWLVGFAGGTVTLMVLGLIGAILYQSITPGKGIDPVLLGLGGPLLGIGFACYKAIFDYRFDGTKDSGAQSDALMKVVAARNQPAGK